MEPGIHCIRTTPPDAMKPRIHGVRTHWIRGFMAFQLGPADPDRDADGANVKAAARGSWRRLSADPNLGRAAT
jgi:hypothetical protein